MDTGWTPGVSRSKPKGAIKDPLDDLGDLLEDDYASPPKKKSTLNGTSNRQQFSAKKQSSKDEDFYSSLAQAAEEGDLSDVSEADVNKMAKSIADLDDLDADLFQAAGSTKTPKRGSLKDKSGKSGTPRRSTTPRSRGGTPRASSPPLRMTSPGNRVISPSHQRVTSPPGRGTPTGKEASGGIDTNRPGSGSRRSPSRKPQSPQTEYISEYRPTTAPGKMTDLNERASVTLKPGDGAQERPRTVPKSKSLDFGDFDADDPLAGIPLSDEEEDLGLPTKKSAAKQQQQQKASEEKPSPRSANTEKLDSPRRSLFDRPPTRSGSNNTQSEALDKTLETVIQKQPPKPALAKKKSEEALFSDDDDFLGGLGIEEKGHAPQPQVKKPLDDDENRPAKSAMDKLLGKDSVTKHLEGSKERKEFVLDSKYTQPVKESEDDYLFGSYMPSAVASNSSSRPTSKRSVRFQDDDDIFGLGDSPPKPRGTSTPAKKADDGLDWLEMATGGKTADRPAEKPAEKPVTKQPEVTKPSTAPSPGKSNKAADWLGLKDDDDEEEEYDFLKASSFSAPARQGPPTFQTKQQEAPKPTGQVGAQKTGVGRPEPTAGKADDRKSAPMGKADYLGLGEEVDPSKLMRTRSDAPKFGVGSDPTDVLKEDDIFVSPRTSEKPDQADSEDEDYESGCKPLFESASRQRQMSPRLKKDNQRRTSPRSPERKALDTSPRTRSLADQINHAVEPQPAKQGTHDFGTHQPAAPQAQLQSAQTQSQPATGGEDELNSSTDFFSFKKKEPVMSTGETQSGNQNGLQLSTGFPSELQTGLQSGLQSTYLPPPSTASSQPDYLAGNLQPQGFQAGSLQLQTGSQVYPDLMTGSMMTNAQQTQQQQQQMMRQQQLKQQQMMKQIQRQQQQFQKQQQQQLQQIQQQFMQPIAADTSLFGVGNSLFQDDMSFGLGGQLDIDAQSKIRRLEVELQYAKDILTSTKARYEEEIQAIDQSYKNRLKILEETNSKREERWRTETEQLMSQQVTRVRQMEEEKAELTASMYKRLEDAEKDKAVEIERLKEVQRQALENIKRDHDETLVRLRRSKDQQIDAAAASHDTSRSLIAAVELIQNNAKDLGELQRKADNWHAQGLDDREINLRAKDEQLKMLQDRLNKQQDDTEQERQRLQELVARLETQIREQTRMLEEERWKVKQEQSRLQGLQNAMEDERRSWNDHQARERMNMEKSREALLEEQKTTLSQLHKERQALAEEQVQFNMKQKLAREEGAQYTSRVTQAKAEYEALSRAVAEAKDKYDNLKEENRREEDRIQDERRRLEKERAKMEKKEAELMESAHMIKEKSQDIEEAYAEGTKKYEEGIMALAEAQRLENEEGKRIDTINQQLNILKMKEKEITEEKLRLSKEKREHEKFRNTLLCPNCRHPTRHNGQNINNTQSEPPQGLLMPMNGHSHHSNGYPGSVPPAFNPALQLTVNTMDAVTEAIKSDRAVRHWKMEALKDQKYLEEQNLYLHALKFMPYSSPKS